MIHRNRIVALRLLPRLLLRVEDIRKSLQGRIGIIRVLQLRHLQVTPLLMPPGLILLALDLLEGDLARRAVNR